MQCTYLKVNGTIVAGRDVTYETPTGNYTVLTGANQDLWARTSVELKPGFEAQPGAVFIARVLDGDIFFCNDIEPIPAPVANRQAKATTEAGPIASPETALTLAPNPANGSTRIAVTGTTLTGVRVTTLSGQELLNAAPTGADHYLLNTTGFAPGLYLVQTTLANGETQTLKLVINP